MVTNGKVLTGAQLNWSTREKECTYYTVSRSCTPTCTVRTILSHADVPYILYTVRTVHVPCLSICSYLLLWSLQYNICCGSARAELKMWWAIVVNRESESGVKRAEWQAVRTEYVLNCHTLQLLEFIVFYPDEVQDLHASRCNDTIEPQASFIYCSWRWNKSNATRMTSNTEMYTRVNWSSI